MYPPLHLSWLLAPAAGHAQRLIYCCVTRLTGAGDSGLDLRSAPACLVLETGSACFLVARPPLTSRGVGARLLLQLPVAGESEMTPGRAR